MGSFTLSSKSIPNLNKFDGAIRLIEPTFTGLNVDVGVVTILLSVDPTDEIIANIESVVPPAALTTQEYLQQVVAGARNFGMTLLVEFAAQNIALGITQAGMTAPVRGYLNDVVTCLFTGSLYDAIAQLKAVPPEHKDATFITDARLLYAVNRIETYLGITLSTSL